ncbi:hypothetical protein CBR_g53507 [Chara braunii]|uniref:Uncharacterized protein n=1 Tax=Chara braunii TaxID=69332 RepID=A0A388MB19_CHABU|nr:hypothetical protein CBR_g53507 [Chara braunii]|eukprot:GBG91693.1 hypothetical protein CBR_g53507 [Chara braunii]
MRYVRLMGSVIPGQWWAMREGYDGRSDFANRVRFGNRLGGSRGHPNPTLRDGDRGSFEASSGRYDYGDRDFDPVRREGRHEYGDRVGYWGRHPPPTCFRCNEDRLKKEEKERKKKEKAEEARLRHEEEEAKKLREKKKTKKAKKAAEKAALEAQREAEFREEMHKTVNMQVHIKLSEVNDVLHRGLRYTAQKAGLVRSRKGKEPTTQSSDEEVSAKEDGESEDEELNRRASELRILEKRKRGEEPLFEDSPPMETAPKRTGKRGSVLPLRLTTRLTRSKTKGDEENKTPGSTDKNTPQSSKKKTPRSTKKKTPVTMKRKNILAAVGTVGKLKYHNDVMQELRKADAPELQDICRKEGIPYANKVDAIFDIVEHRTKLAYGEEQVAEELVEEQIEAVVQDIVDDDEDEEA